MTTTTRVSLPVRKRSRSTWGYGDDSGMHYFRDVLVDADGTVRAWDDVAGHYSLHHDLTDEEQQRARVLADAAR